LRRFSSANNDNGGPLANQLRRERSNLPDRYQTAYTAGFSIPASRSSSTIAVADSSAAACVVSM
jgi:hypothetical protein